MSISLEWVVLPNGVYLRTICKNGVPLPDPTRYLLSYAYPDHASTATIRTYAQYLLPFYKWLDRRGLTLEGITPNDLQRYRRELTLIDTVAPPLLRTRSRNRFFDCLLRCVDRRAIYPLGNGGR